MAHDVFISYSSKDKPTADAVCATLEGRGTRCWIAPRDILPGRDWGEAIVEGIERSRVMVLVFSKNANASPQVKREVERAVNRGVIIVPFRIEEVTPSKNLEYFLGTPHWLDALTRPLEGHLAYLGETVTRLLGGEEPAPRPTPVARTGRFSPAQLAVGVGAVVAVAIPLALWLGKGGGEAASDLVGEWEYEAVPSGPSQWDITFAKDGTYEGRIVWEDEGTVQDYSGGSVGRPIAHPTDLSTHQLALQPESGQLRVATWTPTEGNPDLIQAVSGVIPGEMVSFSSVGKAPTSVFAVFGANWTRVSDTEWKLDSELGDYDWHFTFESKDGRYSFRAVHEEEGTFEAKDGKIQTVSENGLIVDGSYNRTDDGGLVLTSPAGSGHWEPAE